MPPPIRSDPGQDVAKVRYINFHSSWCSIVFPVAQDKWDAGVIACREFHDSGDYMDLHRT